MACCAFAVYLLGQLLLPLAWLRDRVLGVPAPVVSAAAAWSPGMEPPGRPVRGWLARGLWLLIGAEALALLAGAAAMAMPAAAPGLALYHAAMPAALCRALGGPAR
jgi:hypothetical protein